MLISICITAKLSDLNRSFQASGPIAIRAVGAYGAVMASTYNPRPLVPEVMVDGNCMTVIRKRPDIDELINLDSP